MADPCGWFVRINPVSLFLLKMQMALDKTEKLYSMSGA